MSNFEREELEKRNSEFIEKLHEKGVFIPEIDDVVLEDNSVERGHFVGLYSLKTQFDDTDFYFAPFVALTEEELGYQISCCNDYKMIICRLGYYNCQNGKLYIDYSEFGSVHQYFMEHSEKYRDINKVFGNISQNSLPSAYGQVCEMITSKDKINEDKLNAYVEFLQLNHVFVPDYRTDNKIIKKLLNSVKEFVTP